MTKDLLSAEEKEIWGIIKEINEGWLQEDFSPLEKYFHPEVVMVFPKFQARVKGKEQLIKSYRDYVQNADILDYKQENCGVDVAGNSAMAAYRFEVIYEIGGKRFEESGFDMFSFNRKDGKWLIVWRYMAPEDAPANK